MLHKLIFALLAVLVGGKAFAQDPSTLPILEGLWLTDGYGELLEIQGDHLRIYEVTSVSCISATDEMRRPDGGSTTEVVFSGDGDTVRISPASSADTRWLHDDGSISNVFLRRTKARARPRPCRQTPADTPPTNYQVFWQTYAE